MSGLPAECLRRIEEWLRAAAERPVVQYEPPDVHLDELSDLLEPRVRWAAGCIACLRVADALRQRWGLEGVVVAVIELVVDEHGVAKAGGSVSWLGSALAATPPELVYLAGDNRTVYLPFIESGVRLDLGESGLAAFLTSWRMASGDAPEDVRHVWLAPRASPPDHL